MSGIQPNREMLQVVHASIVPWGGIEGTDKEKAETEKTRKANVQALRQQSNVIQGFCANCFQMPAAQTTHLHCGRCKKVNYCSAECQKEDWKKNALSHKEACPKLQKNEPSKTYGEARVNPNFSPGELFLNFPASLMMRRIVEDRGEELGETIQEAMMEMGSLYDTRIEVGNLGTFHAKVLQILSQKKFSVEVIDYAGFKVAILNNPDNRVYRYSFDETVQDGLLKMLNDLQQGKFALSDYSDKFSAGRGVAITYDEPGAAITLELRDSIHEVLKLFNLTVLTTPKGEVSEAVLKKIIVKDISPEDKNLSELSGYITVKKQ